MKTTKTTKTIKPMKTMKTMKTMNMHRTKRSKLTSNLTSILATLSLAAACLAQDGAPPPGGPGGGPGAGGPGPGGRAPGQGGEGGMRANPTQMMERFMAMDANGDGKVAREEATGPFAERIFGRADVNGDGSVDRAELEEFMKSLPARGAEGARGRESAAGGEAGPGAGRGGFEGSMRQANGALRGLRGSAFDAASQKSDFEAVQRLQGALVMSKAAIGSVPMSPAAKAKFGEDKAAFEAAYRRKMLESGKLAMELELAILDGKSGEAKALVAKLHQLEETGHELFKADERAGGEGERPAGGREGRQRRERPEGQN